MIGEELVKPYPWIINKYLGDSLLGSNTETRGLEDTARYLNMGEPIRFHDFPLATQVRNSMYWEKLLELWYRPL